MVKPLRFFILLSLIIFANSGYKIMGQSAVHRKQGWIVNVNSKLDKVDYSNGYTMLSGSFKQIGPQSGNGVVVDAITGLIKSSSLVVTGTITTSIPDGAGGWYIGGFFSKINNTYMRSLAHINADYSLDLNWIPNPNGVVYSLIMGSNVLYVGGSFTEISGQTRHYFAAFNILTGSLNSWDPDSDGTITAMAINGNTIYAAGYFSKIGGLVRNNIVPIDATTGSLLSWVYPLSISGGINSIAASATTVYVGGGGGINALNATNGALLSWYPAFSGQPYFNSLLLDGNTLYAGGYYSTGGKLSLLAAVDTSSGEITNLNSNLNNLYVQTFALSDTRLYVGGLASYPFDTPLYYASSLSSIDGTLQTWNPRPSNEVKTISVTNNDVFLGGDFYGMNWTNRNGFALIDDATDQAWPFDVDFGTGKAYTIAVQDNIVYIGGAFSSVTVNSVAHSRKNLVAIDLTTGSVLPWSPSVDGTTAATDNTVVKSMKIKNNLLYIGGIFLNINNEGVNTARANLAALDLTTGTPASWSADVGHGTTTDQYVNSIDVIDNTLYVAGSFNHIDGQARTDLAAINIGTGNALAWAPSCTGEVYKIRVANNLAFVVGEFASGIGGTPRSHNVAAIDLTTGLATSWNPDLKNKSSFENGSANGIVNDVTITSTDAYIGGRFTTVGSEGRNGLASFSLADGSLNAWTPDVGYANFSIDDEGIYAVAASADRLHIGGAFFFANYETRTNYLEYDICPNPTVSKIESTLSSTAADTYQWYKDNVVVDGAISQTFEIPSSEGSGIYAVEVTKNGCTSRSADYNFVITGFETTNNLASVMVFPNPSQDEFYVEVPEKTEFRLVDLMGRSMKRGILFAGDRNRVETKDLISGTYILIVHASNKSAHFKIIKNH